MEIEMATEGLWSIGVDLGGTKIEVAMVDAGGKIRGRLRLPTHSQDPPAIIKEEIVSAVREIQKGSDSLPAGVGVGVAGQVDPQNGLVHFAPNLDWHEEPLQDDLKRALGLLVVVMNDVRAAAWGEWHHGAGRGCNDLICLFVGTGIGGGVVSGGNMLSGCSNTAGELGHITVDLNGPQCTCGNRGCLEALVGGWAIARQAREAVSTNPSLGAPLMRMAGQEEAITAEIVSQAARAGDPLARRIIDKATEALIAGCVSLINAFNPCRLILGGGVVEGLPELLEQVDRGVRQKALAAATRSFQVIRAGLKNDAGVIGAATLAILLFGKKEEWPNVK
mgnify:CR=1 FL=1